VRAINLASGVLSAFEEHPVQNGARVNDDGVAHFEPGALLIAGDELDGVNEFFGIRIVEQERKALNGLMREAAAAGLFPREVFVEDANGMTGAGQLFATH